MNKESNSPRTNQIQDLAEEIAGILYDVTEAGEDEIESIFNWLESDHSDHFLTEAVGDLADEYWKYCGGDI